MSSPKNWNVEVDRSVLKILQKIPQHNAVAILQVIKLLPSDPYYGDIQKMKGRNDAWRRRIGSYRLFYKINSKNKVILVFHLERRTSKTY